MAKTSVPVLNLDSLIDRPVVVIDGKEYQLLTTAILPPIDVWRLSKFSRRLDELTSQADLTEDEERELERLPDRMCRLVLHAPDDVHAALNPKQRMEVLATFIQPPQPLPPAESGQTTSSTGATSSLASPGSTEATP